MPVCHWMHINVCSDMKLLTLKLRENRPLGPPHTKTYLSCTLFFHSLLSSHWQTNPTTLGYLSYPKRELDLKNISCDNKTLAQIKHFQRVGIWTTEASQWRNLIWIWVEALSVSHIIIATFYSANCLWPWLQEYHYTAVNMWKVEKIKLPWVAVMNLLPYRSKDICFHVALDVGDAQNIFDIGNLNNCVKA